MKKTRIGGLVGELCVALVPGTLQYPARLICPRDRLIVGRKGFEE
jgi:hypothetical protein